MVQFAGFASSSYGFTEGSPKRGGLPHSDIPGSTVARTSPGLFAACHVLHRLSVPRHPPDALTSRSPTPSPKHARFPGYRPSGYLSPTRAWVQSRCASIARRCKAHRRSHTHARIRPRRIWPDPLHGFTTRFTMSESREQRAENRPDAAVRSPSANSKRQASEAGDRPSRCSDLSWARSDGKEPGPPAGTSPAPSVLCSLSSDLRLSGGPGPTRTADLTLIRRAL
jgi:hypothetical protein